MYKIFMGVLGIAWDHLMPDCACLCSRSIFCYVAVGPLSFVLQNQVEPTRYPNLPYHHSLGTFGHTTKLNIAEQSCSFGRSIAKGLGSDMFRPSYQRTG